jgi:hypothetical protein
MTRRPVTTFEKSLDVTEPPELLQKAVQGRSIYQESVPLAPGRYRLNVVAKDVIGGNLNNYEVALDVPHFEEEKLASSSLILADDISKLPTRSIGGGMFAPGSETCLHATKNWASTFRSTTSSRTKRHRSRREKSATRSIKPAPMRSFSISPKISRNFPMHPRIK